MRVAVIGCTGPIGTYLVPRLVEAGHQLVSISRSLREPYTVHPAWSVVELMTVDRVAEERPIFRLNYPQVAGGCSYRPHLLYARKRSPPCRSVAGRSACSVSLIKHIRSS